MRSFDIVNTELVTMELLMLAVPLVLLILLYFLVRKAVSGGVRDAGDPGVWTEERSASPRRRCSTGATPTGR